jgi:hypothetical protein
MPCKSNMDKNLERKVRRKLKEEGKNYGLAYGKERKLGRIEGLKRKIKKICK